MCVCVWQVYDTHTHTNNAAPRCVWVIYRMHNLQACHVQFNYSGLQNVIRCALTRKANCASNVWLPYFAPLPHGISIKPQLAVQWVGPHCNFHLDSSFGNINWHFRRLSAYLRQKAGSISQNFLIGSNSCTCLALCASPISLPLYLLLALLCC